MEDMDFDELAETALDWWPWEFPGKPLEHANAWSACTNNFKSKIKTRNYICHKNVDF